MAEREADAPILLTGFEPFGGDDSNPSWRIAQALHGQYIEGARVEAVCLPTVFGAANTTLRAAVLRHRPQLVLCLGLAANRAEISVERVAINVDDARIPDNAGASPIDEPVIAGAPAAYFPTLPIKAIVAASGRPAGGGVADRRHLRLQPRVLRPHAPAAPPPGPAWRLRARAHRADAAAARAGAWRAPDPGHGAAFGHRQPPCGRCGLLSGL
jgi:hypothetical protein